jgi:hypothetical protein
MKLLKKGIVLMLFVLIGSALFAYSKMDSLSKALIEKSLSHALLTEVTVDSVHITLREGGLIELDGLRVANPEGYSAVDALRVRQAMLQVSVSTLRSDMREITLVALEEPKLFLEYAQGQWNMEKLADNAARLQGMLPESDSDDIKKQYKISTIRVAESAVSVKTPVLPKPITLSLETFELHDVGGEDGTANMAEAMSVVLKAMVKKVLSNTSALPENLLGQAGNVAQEAGETLKSVGKDLKEGLGGLLKKK